VLFQPAKGGEYSGGAVNIRTVRDNEQAPLEFVDIDVDEEAADIGGQHVCVRCSTAGSERRRRWSGWLKLRADARHEVGPRRTSEERIIVAGKVLSVREDPFPGAKRLLEVGS
jgi:hypothetical protein